MEIKNSDFKLALLSRKFYEEIAQNLVEILEKDKRPYCVILVKIRNLNFALPLRTNLPSRDGVGIKTIPNGKGGYKGVDFSKAVILSDNHDEYLLRTEVNLKSYLEKININGNYKKIIQGFKKYVSEYITVIKSGSDLPDKFQFTSLINYHKELKINNT